MELVGVLCVVVHDQHGKNLNLRNLNLNLYDSHHRHHRLLHYLHHDADDDLG